MQDVLQCRKGCHTFAEKSEEEERECPEALLCTATSPLIVERQEASLVVAHFREVKKGSEKGKMLLNAVT